MLGVVYPVAIPQADLDAVQHWQNNGDFEMILVTSDGELLITEGIAADYTAKKELPCKVVHHNEKSYNFDRGYIDYSCICASFRREFTAF